MWNHWVVRASTPREPFSQFESARWIWAALSKLFPDALSAVLMPNHLHLILPSGSSARVLRAQRRKLASFLGVVSRKQGIPALWQPIPPPALIPDRHHLRRQIRYIALNPCRKSLCRDPLEWPWSTYRDIMGAVSRPWVNDTVIAQALREPKSGFRVRIHAYVSGDPSVQISGTPAPRAAPAGTWAEKSIGEIIKASAAALRVPPTFVRRKGALRPLFIHLAHRHCWTQTGLLAQICGITPQAVRLILRSPPPPGIEAAALCLGDSRLVGDSLLQLSK